jgi:hypothetical protein
MSNLTPIQLLEAAQADLSARDEQIVKLGADLAAAVKLGEETEARAIAAETALASAQADLATAKASVESLTADNAKLAKDASDLAAKEQDVEKRASARLAAMQAEIGIAPPLPTGAPGSGQSAGPATITFAEFRTLSVPEQNAHVRKGGKIAG